MKPTVVRLVLCATLFVLWMGYLGYLVVTRPVTAASRPLVLSRPQLQSSQVDVIARIESEPKGETEVTIGEVLHAGDSSLKEGDRVRILNLDECRGLPRTREDVPPSDWSGPGDYLIPLRAVSGQPNRYEVTSVPASPGFETTNLVRIYPATPETRAQYASIKRTKEE